jgi:glycosyltransferase involved in cell wall biosynthesis
MTIIGINAIGTRHSGAATVLLSTVAQLLNDRCISKVIVFVSPKTEINYTLKEHKKLVLREAPALTNNPILRFCWLNTSFKHRVQREKCDVVFNINNYAGQLNVPQVLFIQQSLYFSKDALRYYLSPEVERRDRVRLISERIVVPLLYAISIYNSQHIIVQTNVMKKAVNRIFTSKVKKISVVPPVIVPIEYGNKDTSPFTEMKQSNRMHWLYVGNDSPYKNLSIIRKVSEIAIERKDKWLFHFVGTAKKPIWENAITRWYPYVQADDLRSAYEYSSAVIMPSLSETVGLPMIEALFAGRPVVAADLEYAHEICGSYARYFNPNSVEDLYGTLKSLSKSDINQVKLSKKAVSERFSERNYSILAKILTEQLPIRR